MAFHHFVTIEIEFAGAALWSGGRESLPAGRQSGSLPPGFPLRLVESKDGGAQIFTLFHGSEAIHTLTAEETGELLRLLGQMAVKAPWEAAMGFDGCTYSLRLWGSASSATFSWWVDVPKGWESVGAVAGYVLELADRLGLSY